MKAITIPRTGGPEVMEWTDVDEPVAGEGQVVVAVDAAGVNFIDTYHRTGLYPMELPIVPGLEGAGKVIAAGDGAHGINVGDRVA